MALGDGQALHGGELVAARGVGDLEGADALVAADHLAVGVLDGGDVALAERPLHEAQHQRALAHAAGTKHDHTVVIALLWHRSSRDLRVGGGEQVQSLTDRTFTEHIYWTFSNTHAHNQVKILS